MTQLEKEVLEIINNIIEGEYIGRLKVLEDRIYSNRCPSVYSLEYSLFFFLNADYEPMVFSYTFRPINSKKCELLETENEYKSLAISAFKEFISDEFKNRMLQQVDYYKINLQLPSIDCNE